MQQQQKSDYNISTFQEYYEKYTQITDETFFEAVTDGFLDVKYSYFLSTYIDEFNSI